MENSYDRSGALVEVGSILANLTFYPQIYQVISKEPSGYRLKAHFQRDQSGEEVVNDFSKFYTLRSASESNSLASGTEKMTDLSGKEINLNDLVGSFDHQGYLKAYQVIGETNPAKSSLKPRVVLTSSAGTNSLRGSEFWQILKFSVMEEVTIPFEWRLSLTSVESYNKARKEWLSEKD